MARKRASMREGPLAELFKATEAGQNQGAPEAPENKRRRLRPVDPDQPTVEHAPPAPVREDPPPAARVVDPLPEPAPTLNRPRSESAYMAMIRVAGVGGAGLNAVNRMIDAG